MQFQNCWVNFDFKMLLLRAGFERVGPGLPGSHPGEATDREILKEGGGRSKLRFRSFFHYS